MADGPELAATKRLLDLARNQDSCSSGSPRARTDRCSVSGSPPTPSQIYLGGFSSGCSATRARKSSLIVPGGLPVTARVEGEALTVLHTVVNDWPI